MMGEAMVERAVPTLPGDDLGVARDFYVGKLGFQVQFEATDDGKDGIIGLERGTIELTIDRPMSGHGRNACASLRVRSADSYYEEWRKKVEISRPPRNEPWGGRTFGFQDPFGNSIFVIGPPVT
jgi:catechol 2,3-dioxygenase-like lactoylglutathione lyase family enzyme